MSNYSLQKYKGDINTAYLSELRGQTFLCLLRGRKRYALHPSVGRCNHESGCGYHYTPRQYFRPPRMPDRRWFLFRQSNVLRPSNRCNRQPSVTYRRTMWRNRRACIATSAVSFQYCLIPITAARAKVLERLMEDYRLGATRDGAVIFWQIDRENKVRTGKVMQYNPGDGHRVKDGQTSAVNWIHSILKRQRVLAEEWQLSQCLFGNTC